MTLNILLISAATISFLVVIFIMARKVPYLKTMDLDTVPEEQAARVRDRILLEKLKRAGAKIGLFFAHHISPLFKRLARVCNRMIGRVYALEKKFQKEEGRGKPPVGRELENRLKTLLDVAEEFMKKEKYNEAEKRLIEIISMDSQDAAAYAALYDVYIATKEFKQALQTAEFALKLLLKKVKTKGAAGAGALRLAEAYIKIGDANRWLKNNDAAFENYQKALELEPNSPKNLDKNLEMSIMLKQKSLAADLLTRMEQVNPQNQKLREYGEKIAALS